MTQKHLQNIQILRIIFTIILMITIQREKRRILIVLDDMIADITTNKKFQP